MMKSATSRSNKIVFVLMAVLAIAIGFYPVMYLITPGRFSLQFSKSEELLADTLWNIGFYGHICLGGIAMLVGWTQFNTHWRSKYIQWHRLLGKIYVFTVFGSALAAIYISFYATAGWISAMGFFSLGIVWLFTTAQAYRMIVQKDLQGHERMMIYSYAACFAAVTLRIWLPILMGIFGEFETAYRIVAWLCWVPNLAFAYWIVQRKKNRLSPV